ncbi:MAG TPA: hypothetical protein VNW92_27380, partial [Polyangiaceae bacterium]|nr:hypothetical protein [Polyangiaceae bacterium]
KNGATLAGVRLEANRDTPWPAHAVLALGSSEFSFEDPVLAALAEIEASGDEQMRDDDSIDPPNVASNAGAASHRAPPNEALGAGPSAAAPVAQVPTRAPEPARKAQGFRAVDVVIALVALLVIGLSVLGLTWLFRGP